MRPTATLCSSIAQVALLRDSSDQVGRYVHPMPARNCHLTYCTTELERYADKYRPAAATQPKLERRDLHQPFFPQEVFEAYFDPRKKRMCMCLEYPNSPAHNEFAVERKHAKRVNLDDFKDDAEEEVCHIFILPLRVVTRVYSLSFLTSQDKSEASEAGSQAAEEDYDVEEEYDNDYADDYFDNGEGDDLDDLGGGGAGDPSGGGALVSFIDF